MHNFQVTWRPNLLCNVGLLVPQTHGPDEALVLDRPTGEVASNESGLGDHSLPRLFVCFLARVDNLEHFLLADTLNLGQRNSELGRFLSTLILDSAGEGLGVGRLRPVEQVLGQRGLGGLVGGGRLDILLFLRPDALLHLDLLRMALLLVQLGPQATQILSILRLLVRLTRLLLAQPLIVIQPLAVLLLPTFDIPGENGLVELVLGEQW